MLQHSEKDSELGTWSCNGLDWKNFHSFSPDLERVHWITHNGPVAWLSEGISFVQIDFYLSRSLGVVRSELESLF